jgi:hypothetical protein
MTHQDAGKYAAKHPGKTLNERIASAVREKCENNTISCANVHKIAKKLGVTPGDVGITIVLLEVRLNKCQLGLFGHGRQKKITGTSGNTNHEIRQAIEASLINGRLSCAAAWKISDKFGISKIDIAAVCESMKIKIGSCQIGAFK